MGCLLGFLTVCVSSLFSFVCFASRVIPGVLSWVLTLELSNIMFLYDLGIVVITLCFFFVRF